MPSTVKEDCVKQACENVVAVVGTSERRSYESTVEVFALVCEVM